MSLFSITCSCCFLLIFLIYTSLNEILFSAATPQFHLPCLNQKSLIKNAKKFVIFYYNKIYINYFETFIMLIGRILKASWELLKDSYEYSSEKTKEAWSAPKSFGDIATKNIQKYSGPAPFLFLLGTYLTITGSIIFGTYKLGEFGYNKISERIEKNKIENIIQNLENVPNMALPEEYGRNLKDIPNMALPIDYSKN